MVGGTGHLTYDRLEGPWVAFSMALRPGPFPTNHEMPMERGVPGARKPRGKGLSGFANGEWESTHLPTHLLPKHAKNISIDSGDI